MKSWTSILVFERVDSINMCLIQVRDTLLPLRIDDLGYFLTYYGWQAYKRSFRITCQFKLYRRCFDQKRMYFCFEIMNKIIWALHTIVCDIFSSTCRKAKWVFSSFGVCWFHLTAKIADKLKTKITCFCLRLFFIYTIFSIVLKIAMNKENLTGSNMLKMLIYIYIYLLSIYVKTVRRLFLGVIDISCKIVSCFKMGFYYFKNCNTYRDIVIKENPISNNKI